MSNVVDKNPVFLGKFANEELDQAWQTSPIHVINDFCMELVWLGVAANFNQLTIMLQTAD